MALPQCTLVLGGAASGKSAFAEQLVEAAQRPCLYIATAEAWDDEMRAKIALHQARRGAMWRTIETPRDAVAALAEATPQDVVLLDCATLWLTNHLLAESDLAAEAEALVAALTRCAAPVVVVSNEVGLGIVPDNALSRRFRNAQGALNQQIAAVADTVVFVAAGLPLFMKGTLA